ncbi:MAG: hypothetical protein IT462_06625 [Planctomycetes bacterium]|nr:hypothetical protein [Planctomycetota bacterium]
MDIACKRCGAALTVKDIRPDQNLAVCSYCGAVMRFASPQAGVQTARPAVPMPEKFKFERGAGGISWTWRWFSPVFLFLVFFCIAWDSFLLFWYGVGIVGAGQMGAGAIIMFVFPVAHVAVGVFLTYYTICGFVNSTTVSVSSREISVKHAPLPWKGQMTVTCGDIKQLFSEMKTHQSKNGQTFSYNVNFVTRDGRKKTLLSGLQEADQALYVEQQIEQYLGIKDSPVAGELPRN